MKKPKIRYTTYFNKHYLLKGLALYTSLIKHDYTAKLDILCMDDYTKDMLDRLKLKGVKTIALSDFEDDALREAKSNRSMVEYFWTCTPSLPRYILAQYPQLEMVAYFDADLFFYSSLNPIFTELGKQSIYMVEHRYPDDQKYRDNISGRFNVAVQFWRNNNMGKKCINWWRDKCNEWCYLKEEPGRFGDQLYLNQWPKLFKNIVISKNLGVNAAPWNIAQYKVSKKKNKVYINADKLVVYHFHQLEYYSEQNYDYAHGYQFAKSTVKHIYQPYIKALNKALKSVKKLDPAFQLIPPKKALSAILKSKISKYSGPLYWHLRGIWQKNP